MMPAGRLARTPRDSTGGDSTWLITGATGMIGPSIVDAAVQTGIRVRVLTRRTAPPTDGWPWNSVDDQVEVVSGDVRDTPTLRTAMQGVEVVIHAAGVAHRRPDSRSAMEELVDANVGGARSVAVAANAEGVRRVVLISSASVYGSGSDSTRDETTPTRPTTAYGRSKLESERVMGAILGDALTVLRVCAVSGPRLRGQYATLLGVVRSRWPIPVIEGHGHCLISDHDLADVVTRTALDPDAGGAILNVSDGRLYSVGQIVEAICHATGTPRWRSPIVPGLFGTAALHLLGLCGGNEWTRRQRAKQMLASLRCGPALDVAALDRLLPDWESSSVVDGWAKRHDLSTVRRPTGGRTP